MTYDQLTDRDDLIVAKEGIDALLDYEENDQSEENAATLHALETASIVLGLLIDKLPNPDTEGAS